MSTPPGLVQISPPTSPPFEVHMAAHAVPLMDGVHLLSNRLDLRGADHVVLHPSAPWRQLDPLPVTVADAAACGEQLVVATVLAEGGAALELRGADGALDRRFVLPVDAPMRVWPVVTCHDERVLVMWQDAAGVATWQPTQQRAPRRQQAPAPLYHLAAAGGASLLAMSYPAAVELRIGGTDLALSLDDDPAPLSLAALPGQRALLATSSGGRIGLRVLDAAAPELDDAVMVPAPQRPWRVGGPLVVGGPTGAALIWRELAPPDSLPMIGDAGEPPDEQRLLMAAVGLDPLTVGEPILLAGDSRASVVAAAWFGDQLAVVEGRPARVSWWRWEAAGDQ